LEWFHEGTENEQEDLDSLEAPEIHQKGPWEQNHWERQQRYEGPRRKANIHMYSLLAGKLLAALRPYPRKK
jgi:hypothetical protein